MMRLRDLLSKLVWDPREDFAATTIVYVDRRSAGRRGTVSKLVEFRGSDVLELGKGYLVTQKGDEVSHIPFHRIVEVRAPNGATVWSRGK